MTKKAQKIKLHENTDAFVWAREFMRLKKKFGWEVDEKMMIGWFANSIMAGSDAAYWRLVNEIDALKRENERYKEALIRIKNCEADNYFETDRSIATEALEGEIPEENKRMGCNHPGPICEA